MKLAVKLLYAGSNTVGTVSEVRPHLLLVHGEVSSSTVWETAKPECCNMSNRVGETEVQQIRAHSEVIVEFFSSFNKSGNR
jgi:hypothetical protein